MPGIAVKFVKEIINVEIDGTIPNRQKTTNPGIMVR